jgi:hypothetical protein
MKRLWFAASLLLVRPLTAGERPSRDSWRQWAKDALHTGFIQLAGQPASHKLAEIRYDPFVAQEKLDEGGELVVHYQVPLTEGNSVYMEFKTASGSRATLQQHGRRERRAVPYVGQRNLEREASRLAKEN